jgi:hypothetical protein
VISGGSRAYRDGTTRGYHDVDEGYKHNEKPGDSGGTDAYGAEAQHSHFGTVIPSKRTVSSEQYRAYTHMLCIMYKLGELWRHNTHAK